jgi:hypothetical protein
MARPFEMRTLADFGKAADEIKELHDFDARQYAGTTERMDENSPSENAMQQTYHGQRAHVNCPSKTVAEIF